MLLSDAALFALSLFRLADQQSFTAVRRILRSRIGCPWIQCCLVIVSDTANLPAHDTGKYIVYRIHHLYAASEIFRQVDSAQISCLLIGVVFFQKQFRSRQTEFVDALLHIAYHEAVVMSLSFPGDGA